MPFARRDPRSCATPRCDRFARRAPHSSIRRHTRVGRRVGSSGQVVRRAAHDRDAGSRPPSRRFGAAAWTAVTTPQSVSSSGERPTWLEVPLIRVESRSAGRRKYSNSPIARVRAASEYLWVSVRVCGFVGRETVRQLAAVVRFHCLITDRECRSQWRVSVARRLSSRAWLGTDDITASSQPSYGRM